MREIGLSLLLLASHSVTAAEAASAVASPDAPRIGVASVVVRESTAQLPKAPKRVLIVRDLVFRNERIRTSTDKETLLHLRLLDGTVLTLGPASEMILDDFAINPKTGAAEVQVNMTRGLLRFVGGKHAGDGVRYRVKTRVATIGVRGTAFDLRVGDDGKTEVQLSEGEVSLKSGSGDEVIIDEIDESSSVDESGAAPSEPEIDPELNAEFESLDLSPEQEAEDELIEDELDDSEIEIIEDEDNDTDDVGFEDDEYEEEVGDDGEDGEDEDEGDDDDDDLFDADDLLNGTSVSGPRSATDSDDSMGDGDGDDADGDDSDGNDADGDDTDGDDADGNDADGDDADGNDADGGDADGGDADGDDTDGGDTDGNDADGDDADGDDDTDSDDTEEEDEDNDDMDE